MDSSRRKIGEEAMRNGTSGTLSGEDATRAQTELAK
jgi:hypothetical protein